MFAYAQTPTIVVVDGVASPEECEAIIDHTKNKLDRSTVASEGGHEHDTVRTSSGGFFPHSDFPEVCERVSTIAGIPLERAEKMNVLKYTGDQEYKPHYDTLGEEYLEDGELQVQGKGEILKYSADLWNEVVGMEKIEENLNSPNDHEENNYNFDQWYDITTDDLIEEEQEEEFFSDKTDNSEK